MNKKVKVTAKEIRNFIDDNYIRYSIRSDEVGPRVDKYLGYGMFKGRKPSENAEEGIQLLWDAMWHIKNMEVRRQVQDFIRENSEGF